jgi:lipopolysaccharide export system protein LptA
VADLPLPADSSATDSPHKRVKIINADRLTFQKRGDTAVQKLIGHVRLAQDSTYFFCDSAYLYERDNRLKAFSRVRIEMPDSVLLTSDRLTYDGNTRIAEVYNRILLTDGQSRLNTDRLTYYRAEEYGYYQGGGKLVDDSTVLTSKTGYYYPNRKEAFFRGDVVLTHPDYTLSTDTLGYDTETKVARFVTLTTIVNEDGTIETTRGSYDTQKANIDLFQRSQVRDSSYTLIADTLLYTDGRSLGLARGRVIVIQEDSSLELRGNYGRFNRETDESFITGDAVAIQRMDGDTLYMFADTLFSLKDTQYVDRQQRKAAKLTQLTRSLVDSLRRDSVAQDSLMPPPTIVIDSAMAIEGSALDSLGLIAIADSLAKDSLGLDSLPLGPPTLADFEQRFDTVTKRRFIGYHHVRFFMNDMQGLADSMVYDYDDSLLYLYTDPILWSDDNQLTGDTITVWMKNEQADSMQVSGHSFMASQADTVGYNQLKGRNMQLKFRDNDLYRVRMIGNTESIYFIEADQDSSLRDSLPPAYQGMNKALANEMLIYFAAREVSKIVFLSKPEGIFFPFYEVVFQENALDGLNWRGEERPRKPLWLLPPRPIIDSVAPLPDVLSLPLVPRNPLPSPEAQSLPPATPALLPEEQP